MPKTSASNQLQAYLDWNEIQMRRLISKEFFCDKSKFNAPVLDLPVLRNDAEYRRFFVHAKEAGFKKFNLGLTSIWSKKLPRSFFRIVKKLGIHIVSAHGTSLKYSLRHGVPFQKVLAKDKQSLALLGRKQITVNYDLFSGHLPDLRFSSSFKKTSAQNNLNIANKLGYNPRVKDAEKTLISHIIKALAIVYSSRREHNCLTLEIPGTKGWSMMPSVNLLRSDYLLDNIKSFLPEAGVTIDVAHLLTWGKNKKPLLEAKNIIDKYKHLISMLHICSAGTDNNIFSKLYKRVHNNKYPNWHINGLDASLFIFEPEMVEMVSYIRNIVKRPILEVTESRLPSLTVEDYFSNSKIQADNEWYYKMLKCHSKILRYV